MDNELMKLKQQHFESYKQAILENINNNTIALVDDDIVSLIGTPPLDSMDFIKNKFLELAKKNNVVLSTEKLSKILFEYRKSLLSCCDKIKMKRLNFLSAKVNKYQFSLENEIITFYKKDFIVLNKEIRKILKEQLLFSFEKYILEKNTYVFDSDVSDNISEKIFLDIAKYMRGPFQKQLLENFDIKVLVKDTTLINIVKEQSERYLFTLNNSRLLNEFDD